MSDLDSDLEDASPQVIPSSSPSVTVIPVIKYSLGELPPTRLWGVPKQPLQGIATEPPNDQSNDTSSAPKRTVERLEPSHELDSPDSIHSSDDCSYSSYFERKESERSQSKLRYKRRKIAHNPKGKPGLKGYDAEFDFQHAQPRGESTVGSPVSLDQQGHHPAGSNNSDPDLFQTAPSVFENNQKDVIPCTQEETVGTPIRIKPSSRVPELEQGDTTIQSDDIFHDDSEQDQIKTDFDTIAYIRKYCSKSVFETLPGPEDSDALQAKATT